jgi:hypothetical protein
MTDVASIGFYGAFLRSRAHFDGVVSCCTQGEPPMCDTPWGPACKGRFLVCAIQDTLRGRHYVIPEHDQGASSHGNAGRNAP